MTDPRINVSLRIRTTVLDWLDQIAKETGTSRSDVLRLSVTVVRGDQANENRLKERLRKIAG